MLLLCLSCSQEAPSLEATDGESKKHHNATELLDILKNPSDDYVMVVAHRGDWRNAPENSLQAIQNSIDMGTDMVEIDVRRTKDGQFVLLHDSTLDRTTTGTGNVSDYTLDSLKQLHLRNGYGAETAHRIPTLEEALLLVKDKILIYLDKSPDYIREIYPLLEKTGTTNQTFFYGHFTATELQERYGDLLDKIMYLPKVGDNTENIETYVNELEATIDPLVYLVTYNTEDSPVLPLIKTLKNQGARIWAAPLWPNMCAGHTDDGAVHDPDAHWGWIIEHGANMFCTDRPGLMIDYLHTKGLHL